MKIYIVRHGQTDINLNNQINSLNDCDLNETGVLQAQSLKDSIKNLDYDFIICSPLKRAKHTAEIINVKNKEIILDDRIVERDAGKFTEASLDNIDKDDWWNIYPKQDYEDAEKVFEVVRRVKNFIEDLKEEYSNKKILIVTHGGVYKAFCAYLVGIPEDGVLGRYEIDNCEIKTYIL